MSDAWITVTVKINGTWDDNVGVLYQTMPIYFENPLAERCRNTALVIPTIETINYKVGAEQVIFPFPVVKDQASVQLGDAEGLFCGTRSYTLVSSENFVF